MEETEQQKPDIEGEPDYGDRPETPEPGQQAGETSPPGGVEPGSAEHPEDIQQPPDQERDATDTESPSDS